MVLLTALGVAFLAITRAACINGLCEGAKTLCQFHIADTIENCPTLLGGLQYARSGQQREMPGYNGEINEAAFSHFTDGAIATAFCDASDQRYPRRIGKGLEQFGVE
jgi:hypothetical protein